MTTSQCPHHWIIETPEGPVSQGRKAFTSQYEAVQGRKSAMVGVAREV